MPETVYNMLVQIPLAGVVVYVVVLFLRFLDKMLDKFMGFIAEQRQANEVSISLLSKEIKELGETVNARLSLLEEAVSVHEATRPANIEQGEVTSTYRRSRKPKGGSK